MNPTIEGVVLVPSEFAITIGRPASITPKTEFVVPKSKTNTLLDELFSKPYAKAAAVGSFKILSTFIPANTAESFVAFL